MSRIEALKKRVDALYQYKNTSRAKDWADYLYSQHISAVAAKARGLSERFSANAELVVAAAMLHDIADAIMSREDARHEEECLKIARSYLRSCSFTEPEVATVVDDAIKYHRCIDGDVPETLEGKILATADAVVDFQSDYYDFAVHAFTARGEKRMDIAAWGLEKTDRDFNKRIYFAEIQDEVRPDYERERRRFGSMERGGL